MAERIDEISAIIKKEIEKYANAIKTETVGTVIRVGDGIAIVYGLDDARMDELLDFGNHIYGMVLNLEKDYVGAIIFKDADKVKEGDKVTCTQRILEVPVGEGLLGRVIDPLGNPLDGLGDVAADIFRPIERKAPNVMARKPVSVPLQTGIKVIDALIPIGRGQRELIIGDRQTGKTSIAIDTIINQRDKDVICVYVAIGQKDSNIRAVIETLKKYDALKNTVVVAAGAANAAPLLYIAPYAGITIAEEFMFAGKDVLIVYDDLSKHAASYRELSLLLKRPPGREAFPGDIFYLHSRLLERAAKLDDELGGGSVTALPIIETQAGDITSYIPTNVISITDGQIYLQNDLFYSGIRPAVSAGLSVSRVGGAAQIKAMKKVAGNLRLDLASYRELEAFTQFGSDLDFITTAKLERGKRTIEILKQDLHVSIGEEEQAVILYALVNGFFDDVLLQDVKDFEADLIRALNKSEGKKIKDHIKTTGNLPPANELNSFLNIFKKER